MPGVNEAELKARRRRSAAQLTSSLPGTGTGNRVSSGPDLDPAVAGVSDQPKEKLEDNNIAADVIMADRTEDGCCARVSHLCDTLFAYYSGRGARRWVSMTFLILPASRYDSVGCGTPPPSQRSCSGE